MARSSASLGGLLDPAVSFFSFRLHGELLGVGALKTLDADHVELKSMHTAEAACGRGVGRAMVDHLLGAARARGARRASLESGTMAAFVAAARSLYARAGFVPCPRFGTYAYSPNGVCMTRRLDGGPRRRDDDAVQLVDGRYKCNWCGADLDLPFRDHDTIEIVTEHDGIDVRVIVVGGEEHHRCERPISI